MEIDKQTVRGVPDRIRELLGESVEKDESIKEEEPIMIEIVNKSKENIQPMIRQFIQDNPIPGAKDVEKDVNSSCPDRDLVIKRIYECNKNIFDLKIKYIQLGGALIELKPYCKYIHSWAKGRYCKNIYEVAEHCFNLKKSTVINIIGITLRFGYLMSSLKPEYESYSYSQLCEMLPLSDEQLKLVTPRMTIQEIRALRKVSKVDQTSGQLLNSPFFDPLKCQLELTNDKQRTEFITLYKYWGVWLEVPELNLKFYKIDLNNGDFLVVTEYPLFTIKNHWGEFNYSGLNDKKSDTYSWHKCVVKKGTSPNSYGYDHVGIGDSELCTYFKSTHAKVICPFPCKTLEEYKQKIKIIERNKRG